jgi:NAD(P)-dependent dehydrogenase (short-subunit alcohol dehydrogenase family)/acyl carrier protein
LAQALVNAGADRLALMGRDALPASETWDGILADEAADLQLKHKLAPFVALRRRGVKLSIHCGPLTDRAAVAGFLTQVRSALGPIAGLIHAAGVVDAARPRFIDKTADDFRRIAEPKVAGLNTLLAASEDDPMRFVALCSSVAAAVPTMGVRMSDYAMANTYMDALALHRAARGGDTLWLSLQWAGWNDTGMHTRFDPAIEQIVREGLGAVGLAFCDSSIGAGLFAGVLAQGIAGPVIPAPVIAENLDAALPRLLDLLPAPRARAAMPRPRTSSGAAALDTLSDAEIDRLLAGFDAEPIGTGEAAASHDSWLDSICRVVADVLELADGEFGPDVPFRDVGIDSVAALRVVQRLEAEIALAIAPRMLIEHPTPRALAAAVAPLWREAAE